MVNNVYVYSTPDKLAEKLSDEFMNEINNSKNNYYLAISGGSTPVVLFKKLAQQPYNEKINWEKLHIFWCDERCVPPYDSESNFGLAKKTWLDFIKIPEQNIHRIKGEENPNEEAVRYAMELDKNLPSQENGFPQFDRILLGVGEDGHTASIFPGKNFLFTFSNFCGVAKHPESGQFRISLTRGVLNSSKHATFIVTGKKKSKILADIIKHHPISKSYPAASINPGEGFLDWEIDEEASKDVKDILK